MTGSGLGVAAVLAPAVGRAEVDPLTGTVRFDDRGATISNADGAALETALGLGEAWDVPVTAVSAGDALAVAVLEHALAVGVHHAVHLEVDDDAPPATVGALLAEVLGGTDPVIVVAGAHGSDVASAAVPAYIAHHLGAEQALGLVEVEPDGPGRCRAVRRLDRGARERLAVAAPAVLSVEGPVANLRRAGMRAVLEERTGRIEHVRPELSPPSTGTGLAAATPRPWRPRTRVVAGPTGSTALERIRDLTGVSGADHQVRRVEADPAEAAELILDQLGELGLGPDA